MTDREKAIMLAEDVLSQMFCLEAGTVQWSEVCRKMNWSTPLLLATHAQATERGYQYVDHWSDSEVHNVDDAIALLKAVLRKAVDDI